MSNLKIEIPHPWWEGDRCKHCNFPVSTGNEDPIYNGCQNDKCPALESDECWNCKNLLGYKLITCCSGRDCGCMGYPIDPPFCSDKCQVDFYESMQELMSRPIEETDGLPF